MLTPYDKAGAAVIAAGLSQIVGVLLGLEQETTIALTTLLTGFLVWLVPNKET
jgi:hypothetical protein